MGDADAPATTKAVLLRTLEERNEELARLDEYYHREKRRLQDETRSLREQCNAVTPISRLPPEVLAIAFETLVADYCESRRLASGNDTYKTSPRGWVIVLHICHHWRSVALRSPRLWTRIELRCEPYVQLALVHSGDLPLTVFGGRYPSFPGLRRLHPDPIIQSLFSEFRRLRSARFEVARPVQFAFDLAYKEGMKLQAPMLETLVLYTRPGTAITELPLLSEMDLPSLVSLTITEGAFLHVQPFIRPTLTSLDLSFSPDCRPSSLIEVLDGLPLLQRLELSGIGEEPLQSLLGPTPSWCHTIPLLHLKYLSLASGSQSLDVVHLLECLRFPVDTEIIFALVKQHDAPIVEQCTTVLRRILFKALVSNTPTRAEATHEVIPRVIEVLDRGELGPSLSIALWPTLGPWTLNQPSNTIPQKQRLSLTVSTLKNDAIVPFFDLVNLSEVVVMDIEHGYSASIWLQALQNHDMPKLQSLILTDSAVDTVLLAMSAPLPPSTQASSTLEPNRTGGGDARRYLFPALKTLTLNKCMFRRRSGMVLPGDLFHDALKTLPVRAKYGYKLEKLEIRRPINLTRTKDLSALRDPRIAESVEMHFDRYRAQQWGDDDDDTESAIDSDDVMVHGE